MEGRLLISLLAAVQLPALWRRIDVSGNRRRHPADTEAVKDQQVGLCTLAAPDCPCENENYRPDDGEASTVDPIVSEAKHLLPLFLSMDTIYNFSSVGSFMKKSRIPTWGVPCSTWGAALPFLREAFLCSSLHDLSLIILRFVIGYITYCNIFVKGRTAKNGLEEGHGSESFCSLSFKQYHPGQVPSRVYLSGFGGTQKEMNQRGGR